MYYISLHFLDTEMAVRFRNLISLVAKPGTDIILLRRYDDEPIVTKAGPYISPLDWKGPDELFTLRETIDSCMAAQAEE